RACHRSSIFAGTVYRLFPPQTQAHVNHERHERKREPLDRIANVALRAESAESSVQLPLALETIRLGRIEQQDISADAHSKSAFDRLALGKVQYERPSRARLALAIAQSQSRLRKLVESAEHLARLPRHVQLREVGTPISHGHPAAVDENPAACLELERREHSIPGSALRGRHVVEQDLSFIDVAAARADALITTQCVGAGCAQRDGRLLTPRVLGLEPRFLIGASELPQ